MAAAAAADARVKPWTTEPALVEALAPHPNAGVLGKLLVEASRDAVEKQHVASLDRQQLAAPRPAYACDEPLVAGAAFA